MSGGLELDQDRKKRMGIFSVSDDLTEMMVGHTENFHGGAFLVESTPTFIIKLPGTALYSSV